MSTIAVNGLSKHFGGNRALAGVNLKIGSGEMVALIGASGSGKSTLIRHIAGLELGEGAASAVDVLGQRIQGGGRSGPGLRNARRDIGVIFQQFNLVGRLSLLTNVAAGALGRMPAWRSTCGLFARDEKIAAMRAMARVGIERHAGQRASTLSGGQQQRGAIARALVQGAEVMLADEPIASLDPRAARRVMDVLAELNRQDGITVLVSIHQVEYAIRYCERTIALRDGAVVYDGPSRALTPRFLSDLYGAESEELFVPGLAAPADEVGSAAPRAA